MICRLSKFYRATAAHGVLALQSRATEDHLEAYLQIARLLLVLIFVLLVRFPGLVTGRLSVGTSFAHACLSSAFLVRRSLVAFLVAFLVAI